MTLARVFEHVPKLAKLVLRPGGRTLEHAVRAAELNMEQARERNLAALDETLETLRAAIVEFELEGGKVDHLHRRANEVIGVGGAYGLEELGQAAYSLCDLLDVFVETGAVSRDALMVHADSLKLLRASPSPLDAPYRKKIVRGLSVVVERLRPEAETVA